MPIFIIDNFISVKSIKRFLFAIGREKELFMNKSYVLFREKMSNRRINNWIVHFFTFPNSIIHVNNLV